MTELEQVRPDLEQRSQRALIDFLNTDIELCFTILQSARLTSSHDHFIKGLNTVRTGLATIRHLIDRVQVPGISSQLQAQADQLERQLVLVVPCRAG